MVDKRNGTQLGIGDCGTDGGLVEFIKHGKVVGSIKVEITTEWSKKKLEIDIDDHISNTVQSVSDNLEVIN